MNELGSVWNQVAGAWPGLMVMTAGSGVAQSLNGTPSGSTLPVTPGTALNAPAPDLFPPGGGACGRQPVLGAEAHCRILTVTRVGSN